MPWKSRIPKITAEMLPMVDAIMQQSAETIADRAKQRVPQNTGRLHDSIHVERTSTPGERRVIAGNYMVWYGHIVEHGGAHTPPRPFLLPALQESAGQVVAAATKAMRKL